MDDRITENDDELVKDNVDKTTNWEETRIPVGQGAVKKRIRYKQKDVKYKTIHDSDEDLNETKNNANVLKPQDENNKADEIVVDSEILEKVVVPTKTTILSLENLPLESQSPPTTPVTVFVKTTRKLFTPIAGIEDKEVSKSLNSSTSQSDDTALINDKDNITQEPKMEFTRCEDKKLSPVTHLPPIPASPTPQRKFKEISPSIRLMMVKYNQKVELESSGYKSGGSSGSASPVAWRSPVMDRRVRTQTEKYQEDLRKMSPLLERREVQKSASLGLLTSGKKQLTIHKSKSASDDPYGILKSSLSNLTQIVNAKQLETKIEDVTPALKLTLSINEKQNKVTLTSPDERAKKIQKAKEEFLNAPIPGPSSAPPDLLAGETEFLKYPTRNRLSQISCGSDTSCDSSPCEGILIKSASAGMINVDPNTYKQFDPTVHGDGYVSLPRANKKHKSNIFNNITAKFRKVKMRRNRDLNKMNTISTLCRQSLVVDINPDNPELIQSDSRKESLTVPSISGGSSSEDTSTPSSRSGSWIKKAKFFKNKP